MASNITQHGYAHLNLHDDASNETAKQRTPQRHLRAAEDASREGNTVQVAHARTRLSNVIILVPGYIRMGDLAPRL